MATQTQTQALTPQSSMKEILDAYPGAQRILFNRHHIGGCHSCGFEPTDSLEKVLAGKGASAQDAVETLAAIEKDHQNAAKVQMSCSQLDSALKAGKVKLIDLRSEDEHNMVKIEGDMLATQELVEEVFTTWPKDTAIVLYCHTGKRSLDAALSLLEQGFTDVKSLSGGIDAWSQEIDPLTPRY